MADKGDGFDVFGVKGPTASAGTQPLSAWLFKCDVGYALDGIFDQASYDQGLEDGQPAPPSVAIVSPDPSVEAGEPGGFPDDETAFTTPIVLEVVAPDGIMLAVIALRYRDELDAERTVYRRGSFRRGFAVGSYVETVNATTFRFHCVPDGQWRASSTSVLDDLEFDVDVAGGDPLISLSPIGASS